MVISWKLIVIQYISIAVSTFASVTHSPSTLPSRSAIFRSYSRKHTQKIMKNHIKKKCIKNFKNFILWVDKATKQKEILQRSGHKNHRPTCFHTQECHKNTKLNAVRYVQRTQWRLVQALEQRGPLRHVLCLLLFFVFSFSFQNAVWF